MSTQMKMLPRGVLFGVVPSNDNVTGLASSFPSQLFRLVPLSRSDWGQ